MLLVAIQSTDTVAPAIDKSQAEVFFACVHKSENSLLRLKVFAVTILSEKVLHFVYRMDIM